MREWLPGLNARLKWFQVQRDFQGPDALAVCRAHRGLPVGFLLLRYSV